MATKKKTGPTPVETVKHKDKRVNIPTEETRRFMTEEKKGDSRLRYPRDPSLDPQLVWKGKDEQDGTDLEVPIVPIFIQEKIHPKAIIENLRQTAAAGEVEPELTLFDDFNGIEWEDQIDFYSHEQNWSNRMILGDSLMVMGSLAEKEALKGKVQMVYIDPPYGIKFGSNWQVSTRKRDVKDNKAEDTTRQPEQIKAFRDTWKLGIHSYLSYLRDRLVVARDLLTESGSVFVQIGDENVHRVRMLMDEVFGDENFVSLISVRKLTGVESTFLPATTDFVLFYAKQLERLKYRQLFVSRSALDSGAERYDRLLSNDSSYRSMTLEERRDPSGLAGDRYQLASLTSDEYRPATTVPFEFRGRQFHPGQSAHWKTSLEGLERLAIANRIEASGRTTIRYRRFLDDFPATQIGNLWFDISGAVQSRTDPKVYAVQTSTALVQRCMLMSTDPGDLVIDPTCGSGTTAYVAEQWGRRWITIDTSRVALALARTRLMSARFPYFFLSDSPDGARKQAQIDQSLKAEGPFQLDVKKGFVYKAVPHVTLKSIANNPDIKEGMSREQIDAVIAKQADKEILYDQPYEEPKRVRVTGPFTVESLSPHRFVTTDPEAQPMAEVAAEDYDSGQFVSTILENLKRAGVQNTIKQERLLFDVLDPFAGKYLNATGEYTEKDGTSRSVAVAIGPEHGTVSTDLIREAAKEALKGVGFDILVVCGFAFDPAVSEDTKQYGNLVVLPTRMNPDLAMGDELLKKTGAGNLFMVFGEPDITWSYEEGQLVVELHGLDVYDPTTGEIRSHSTDDIACWFIDTNYNNESFFVRHAYFTGADKPYEKLKRALKADIDERAWASLYSTKSRPFDKPATGSFAVKVINHYGDEVLKVYDV